VFGAFGQAYDRPQPWSLTTSWRYYKSDRHYVGSDYQGDRDEEGSQVINRVHQGEVTLRRWLNDRWNLSCAVPIFDADRSNPLRFGGQVVARSETHASGIGDVIVTGRRWMLDPATHGRTNVSLGVGIKLPTGEEGVEDERTRLDMDGNPVVTDETVDQSIQPGDGGYGVVFDLNWFYRVAQGRVTFYTQATYLFNPRGTNGVPTNRGRESEAIMSVADQYVARVGADFSGPKWHGWSIGLGYRLEGVPSHDVFGSSKGFRRPGFAVSIEPWLSWSKGSNTVVVGVPIAQYRNRTKSVPDLEDDRHGDAAFADWVVMASYSRRFGKTLHEPAANSPACTQPLRAKPATDEGPKSGP
jgi:hypothetical protein